MSTLADKIASRAAGICLYGIAPPKLSSEPQQLATIVAQQEERFARLPMDGLVVYDIVDEKARNAEPRPFPFLPTIDAESYARQHLARVARPKIVYRSVQRFDEASFSDWLDHTNLAAASEPCLSVFVGAPSSAALSSGLRLAAAYELASRRAPRLQVGAIAIAERHARRLDEHERMLAKMDQGCRFFITQAVYDPTSTKSLISDYALHLRALGRAPVPLILTFSPCGSLKTLDFMKWLGIAFPRWLENELRHAADPLRRSVDLCRQLLADVRDYAREKGIPIGINVESVSIRKAEIEASEELFLTLRDDLTR